MCQKSPMQTGFRMCTRCSRARAARAPIVLEVMDVARCSPAGSVPGARSYAMSTPLPPRQLRLIIETDDFDDAVWFYRELLGMPEQLAFATEGDDRVSILHAGLATIEIASRTHAQSIDIIEGAPSTDKPVLRLALEVGDTNAVVRETEQYGVPTIAPPVTTPFRTINARVQGPTGWQVTFFQELETLDQRSQHQGFSTDENRPR